MPKSIKHRSFNRFFCIQNDVFCIYMYVFKHRYLLFYKLSCAYKQCLYAFLSALGNMWLSVHTIVDPSHQYQSEIIPPSLAEEMEDISFSHCNKLMNEATKV